MSTRFEATENSIIAFGEGDVFQLLEDCQRLEPEMDFPLLHQMLRYVAADYQSGRITEPTTHGGYVVAVIREYRANLRAYKNRFGHLEN